MEYVTKIVTCETPNCENENIGITIDCALPLCVVFCGVCGNEIINKINA